MARHLTQTLTKLFSPSLNPTFKLGKLGILSPFGRSFSGKAHLIEVELDSSSGDKSGEVEVIGLNTLEDVIHNMIVRRLEPNWLPFRPGFSYWVPPKPKADNLLDLVGKLTSSLSDGKPFSATYARGWPCPSYYFEDSEQSFPVESLPVDLEVQVPEWSNPEKSSLEDE